MHAFDFFFLIKRNTGILQGIEIRNEGSLFEINNTLQYRQLLSILDLQSEEYCFASSQFLKKLYSKTFLSCRIVCLV